MGQRSRFLIDSGSGVYAVAGAIGAAYAAMSGPYSVLGRPQSNENDANRSAWGTTGRLNLFDNGYIVWSANGGLRHFR